MGNTHTIPTEILARITAPKPHRKGATEERIFADMQKARMTAELIKGLPPIRERGGE